MTMTTLEKVAYIRMFLPEDAPITDAQIQFFVERWEAQLIDVPDNDYKVIYNALVDSVRWIILQQSSRNVGGRWREREAQMEIDIIDADFTKSWKDYLTYLLANPEIIDPSISSGSFSNIVVGGVSQQEVARVKNDPDSRGNGYSLGQFYAEGFSPDDVYSKNFSPSRRRFYN